MAGASDLRHKPETALHESHLPRVLSAVKRAEEVTAAAVAKKTQKHFTKGVITPASIIIIIIIQHDHSSSLACCCCVTLGEALPPVRLGLLCGKICRRFFACFSPSCILRRMCARDVCECAPEGSVLPRKVAPQSCEDHAKF